MSEYGRECEAGQPGARGDIIGLAKIYENSLPRPCNFSSY
jgi:hypothetical protein